MSGGIKAASATANVVTKMKVTSVTTEAATGNSYSGSKSLQQH